MNIFHSLALAALLIPALSAQTKPATPATPIPQAKEAEPDLATMRAMKGKVFEIKYRNPKWLEIALRPLGSGVKGVHVESIEADGLHVISVRDFPENLAAIEEAIKRLDVPSDPKKASDVELTIQVLFATKHQVADADLPADLQKVVQQLKGTLAYRSYTLAGSFVQRAQIQEYHRIEGRGMLDAKTYGSDPTKDTSMFQVDWLFQGGTLDIPKEGPVLISLREFSLAFREIGTKNQTLADLRTDTTFKEGEKVVVGTSVVKDKGLIVVLTARRVN